MADNIGRKKKWPEGVPVKKYPIDSELIRRVGNFGTANETLAGALEIALEIAQAGAAAGIKPQPLGNRETIVLWVPAPVADAVSELAKSLTGKDLKFEKALEAVIDVAEKAKKASN